MGLAIHVYEYLEFFYSFDHLRDNDELHKLISEVVRPFLIKLTPRNRCLSYALQFVVFTNEQIPG